MTQLSTGAIAQRPEVAQLVNQFLTRVRGHLSDLSAEELDELLDGLDADLSEQLAEGGALPDPGSYAAELRAAAGLPAARRARLRGGRRSLGARLVSAPDDLRTRWFTLMARNDVSRATWSMLEAVRPAWWVLRAWVAVSLLDALAGPWEYLTVLPTLGVPVLGPVLLLVAVVLSVRIGQGKLWPGSGPDRTLLARLVLAGLNLVAILAPLAFHFPDSRPYVVETVYARAVPTQGGGADAHPPLRSGRDVVRNIYAYDSGVSRSRACSSSTRRVDRSRSRRPRPWGSAPTARSPAPGSTARRRSSTSSPCRSAPSATAPASARSTPRRWVYRPSTSPRWPRCRPRHFPPNPRGDRVHLTGVRQTGRIEPGNPGSWPA